MSSYQPSASWRRRDASWPSNSAWIQGLLLGVALAGGSLITAWLLVGGHAVPAVGAALICGATPFLLAKPVRLIYVGLLLMLLIPSTTTVAFKQASTVRIASLAVLVGIALQLRTSSRRTSLSVVDVSVAVFAVYGIISYVVGIQPPHGLRPAVNVLLPLCFYAAFRTVGNANARTAVWTIVGGATLASLSVWYEALVIHRPLFSDPLLYHWRATDSNIFRPGGVFYSPPAAATVLSMAVLLALPLLSARGWRKSLLLTCIALDVGAILLTATRGGFLGLAVGLVVFAGLRGSGAWPKYFYALAIAAFVAGTVIVPRVVATTWVQQGVLRQGTLAARQSYWSASWPLVKNSTTHLLIGHGIDSLIIGQRDYPGQPDPDIASDPELTLRGPHSQYMRTLLEEGIIGLVLLGAWLLGSVVLAIRAAFRPQAPRGLLAGCCAATVSFLVISFVDDTMRDPASFACVAAITGLVVSLAAKPRVEYATDVVDGPPEA